MPIAERRPTAGREGPCPDVRAAYERLASRRLAEASGRRVIAAATSALRSAPMQPVTASPTTKSLKKTPLIRTTVLSLSKEMASRDRSIKSATPVVIKTIATISRAMGVEPIHQSASHNRGG